MERHHVGDHLEERPYSALGHDSSPLEGCRGTVPNMCDLFCSDLGTMFLSSGQATRL